MEDCWEPVSEMLTCLARLLIHRSLRVETGSCSVALTSEKVVLRNWGPFLERTCKGVESVGMIGYEVETSPVSTYNTCKDRSPRLLESFTSTSRHIKHQDLSDV